MTDTQRPALSRSAGGTRGIWVRRILVPLLILGVAGMILMYSRQRDEQHAEEVEHALLAMIEEVAGDRAPATPPRTARMEASAGLVERLEEVLAERQPGLPGLGVMVMPGDASPPIGDGSATHHAWITMHGGNRLTIRLHHPGDAQRIRVLGYATTEAFP